MLSDNIVVDAQDAGGGFIRLTKYKTLPPPKEQTTAKQHLLVPNISIIPPHSTSTYAVARWSLPQSLSGRVLRKPETAEICENSATLIGILTRVQRNCAPLALPLRYSWITHQLHIGTSLGRRHN